MICELVTCLEEFEPIKHQRFHSPGCRMAYFKLEQKRLAQLEVIEEIIQEIKSGKQTTAPKIQATLRRYKHSRSSPYAH